MVVQTWLAMRAEPPAIPFPMAILLRAVGLRCAEFRALPQITWGHCFAISQLLWRHHLLAQPRPKDVSHSLQAARRNVLWRVGGSVPVGVV